MGQANESQGVSGDRPAAVVGEVDSEVRKALHDRDGSAIRKYSTLVVGKPGLWPLINYELRMALFSGRGGALGYALRQKFYRGMFGSFGRGVVIGRNVVFRHPHRIHLGDNIVIDDNCVLDAKGTHDRAIVIESDSMIARNTMLSCKAGTIHLGAGSNISVNCTLISETHLHLGKKVLIAGHCYIIAGGNHGIDRTDIPIVEQPMTQRGGVRIEDGAWLGAQVTVLDGVTIGADAVIAAGAVVTRSVEPFIIAGGVPAKPIRDRRGN